MEPTNDYIFIMHHFDEDGRRRAKQLADILGMLKIKTVYGENFCGQKISDGVRCRLESARLSIALLTKVAEINDNNWPSQWLIQEITWAAANKIPTLLLVEEGVVFDAGINGDLEKIYFKKGDFAEAVLRIAEQARTLLNNPFAPVEPPEPTPGGKVESLILNARNRGLERRWNEVEKFSMDALALDPNAWRAMLSLGVAQVYLGNIKTATATFLQMLEMFCDNEQALAAVYHNYGWIEEIRSAGGRDHNSLQKQIECYEKSLSFDHSRVNTRASLLLCRVLMGEKDKAGDLLTDSLGYPRFLDALRFEVENRGWLGHLALNGLPDWLYPVLFPKGDSNDDSEYLRPKINDKEEKMRLTRLSNVLAATIMILALAFAAFAESGQLG